MHLDTKQNQLIHIYFTTNVHIVLFISIAELKEYDCFLN